MRVGILGPLQVSAGGRPIEVGGSRLRGLLILLAVAGGRVVSAERLIDDLWDGDPPSGASNALQSLVSRLRSVVGKDMIESHPTGYRLNAAVDAVEFEERVAAARKLGPAGRAPALVEALALWRGATLADVAGQPFAEGLIVRLDGLRAAALADRIDADLALGRHADLVPELQELVAADPLGEALVVRLMKALYGTGRQAEALHLYGATRRELAETLGVDPSPELEHAHLALLRHEFEAPTGREGAAQTNLRAQLTSFIGRDDDVNRVAKLLREGRLVTLTGPGGAGKTKLSQVVGDRMLVDMPDGVWVAELAPVTDPAEIPHAVHTAMGLRAQAAQLGSDEGPTTMDRVLLALRSRRTLLVLDNCEHLIGAAAEFADRLLARCPEVRILATSREPLGIMGESLWPVEPLALPPAYAGVAEAARSASVRLFVERGAAGRPGFELTSANVGWVVEICRALDGMPLAIELSAARLRALTPEQIANRLSDRFRLLTGGSRTAMPRHQTLRAVVEWSWELLSDEEQVLWRRLSFFAGGATLESAEAICDVSDPLDLLTALVDKSLVLVSDEGRYRMLETIREYGMERLADAGETGQIQRAHGEYFLALAETAEPELRRRDQVRWLTRLGEEHDNLHAALRAAIKAGDAPTAVRFCAALGWYWWMRTLRREIGESVAAVLEMPGLQEDATTAAALGIAAMASLGGDRDYEEIKDWASRAAAIVEKLPPRTGSPILRLMAPVLSLLNGGSDEVALARVRNGFDDPDPWLRAIAHGMYGQLRLNLGTKEGVEEHYQISLAGFRELGERWGMAFALTSLAELLAWRGEYRASADLCEEALRLSAEYGSVEDNPMVHMRLALALWTVDEHEKAREVMHQVGAIADRTGDPSTRALMEYVLAEFARFSGRLEESSRRLDRARALNEPRNGPRQLHAVITSSMGLTKAFGDDLPGASLLHAEALRLAVEAHDAPVLAVVIVGHADLAFRSPDGFERAASLLGSADGVRGSADRSNHDALRLEAELKHRLGDAAYAAAFASGEAKSLEAVIAELSS